MLSVGVAPILYLLNGEIMKKLVLIAFLFTLTDIFSQDGFYTWIDHTPKEYIQERGDPAQIIPNSTDTLYVYQTELGYTSFRSNNGIIFSLDNTYYTKSKSKSKQMQKELLAMYEKDGFKISEKKASKTILTNTDYKIAVNIYFAEGLYAVSESAYSINYKQK